MKTVVITGGAGYIGSALTAFLLQSGYHVTVIDNLMYGGDSLLAFLHHPNFRWVHEDVRSSDKIRSVVTPGCSVIHLAAIAGFPACQNVGKNLAFSYNVEAAEIMYRCACDRSADRFIFPSTYTAFGNQDENQPVSENAPGNPQTVYAESKIEAENRLIKLSDPQCKLIILRLADVYGISPRTRFDVLINQLVWQALNRREITIYQRGYWRSFIHVSDLLRGFVLFTDQPLTTTGYSIYNLGFDSGNATKEEIGAIICELIPGTRMISKDITFGGYRRDIRASFNRIYKDFHYTASVDLRAGIIELRNSILSGLIREPERSFHHNARFAIN